MSTIKLKNDELDIFFNACNLPIDQQQNYIKSQCHTNIQLCNEIISLVKSYHHANTFFKDFATDILGVNINDDASIFDHDPYQFIDKEVNHFKIKSQIGTGGMGVVYLAEDQKLNRLVVLKFLPMHLLQDSTAIMRFRREAQMASTFDDPNIGTIYSVEDDNAGNPFIVMAYYKGETLETKIENNDLEVHQVIELIIQICNGLGAAHKKNIIHRDIKPSNIIVLEDGRVKILDFGLAKLSDNDLTATGIKMGTLAYMSPEHFKDAEISNSGDIWSLGVVFYQMISGRRPFTGSSQQAVMYSILNDSVDLKPLNCNHEIKQVIFNCLKKDPAKRTKSTKDIVLALEKTKKLIPYHQSHQHFWQNYQSHWFESLVFIGKRKYILPLFFSSLLIMAVFVILTFSPNITEKRQYLLSANKHIAVTVLQKDLSELELGLLNTVSQSLINMSQAYPTMWVVPENKSREYRVTNLSQIRGIFGVNLIIKAKILKTDSRYNIELELLDSRTLKLLKKQVIQQTTSNLAIFQESMNTQLIELLELPQSPRQIDTNNSKTSHPQAYQNYMKGIGILQRPDKKQNYALAIAMFEKALQSDSQFVSAYIQLAQTYWLYYEDTQNIEYAKRAEELSDKALTINPESLYAFLNLGKIHNGLGRYGTALASYQLALKQSPNNTDVFHGLATVYENINQLDLAENYLIKATITKPDFWLVFNKLGAFYLSHGAYQKAIEQFEKALTLTPANAWLYSNLGTSYWYLGKIDKTIGMFQQALNLQEDYSTYANLATLYFYQQNYKKSQSMYEKALALDSHDFRVWGNFALTQILTGSQKQKAINNFKHALNLALEHFKLNHQDIELITNIAAYYAWLDNRQESLYYLTQAIELSPNDLEVLFQIAATYEKLAIRDKAIQWLEKAITNGYSTVDIINYPFFDKLKNDPQFKTIIKNNR